MWRSGPAIAGSKVCRPRARSPSPSFPAAATFQPGRHLRIALGAPDATAAHAELTEAGVELDELMGGDGGVPRLFFSRDGDKNQLMVVEASR